MAATSVVTSHWSVVPFTDPEGTDAVAAAAMSPPDAVHAFTPSRRLHVAPLSVQLCATRYATNVRDTLCTAVSLSFKVADARHAEPGTDERSNFTKVRRSFVEVGYTRS